MSESWTITAANKYGALIPQTVQASSLREALSRAAELPFAGWFPEEEDDEAVQDASG